MQSFTNNSIVRELFVKAAIGEEISTKPSVKTGTVGQKWRLFYYSMHMYTMTL